MVTSRNYATRPQVMSANDQHVFQMKSFQRPFRALVLGSSGTIGSALCDLLGQIPNCTEVIGLSRSSSPAIELTNESSLRAAAQSKTMGETFHLIIDATGALTIDGVGPEKSLSQCKPDFLSRSFEINAIGRALVLKHFTAFLPKHERSIFAVLSARVGSIEDNRLGGWYGYRASKAAGNMMLQSAAIEIHRSKPQAVFAALQPGTVDSGLSAPFNKGHDLVSPQDSAQGMLMAIDRLRAKGSAWFVDYRGEEIPW